MKRFVRISLLVVVLFNFVSFVHAQVNSDSLLPTNQKGITIKHTYYSLSYSEADKQAEWVAYYLTPALINVLKNVVQSFYRIRFCQIRWGQIVIQNQDMTEDIYVRQQT